jgi:lipid kinase YegS
MTETVRLILHAKHAENDLLRQAVQRLREEGHRIDVRLTWEGDHLTEFARESCDRGHATVIAGGGDGTIRAVVEALLQTPADCRPTLGILPLGTANDFANACGLVRGRTLELQLRNAIVGPTSVIDAARCNGEAFINMATGGQVAEVTTATSRVGKGLLGKLAYMISGVQYAANVESWPLRIRGDGIDFDGDAFAVFVGNGRTAGGGFQLCPEAVLDDGELDVVIVPEVPMEDLVTVSTVLIAGGRIDDVSFVESYRTRRIEVEAPEGVQINLDGEPIRDHEFVFEVVENAIRVRLGPEAPLLETV